MHKNFARHTDAWPMAGALAVWSALLLSPAQAAPADFTYSVVHQFNKKHDGPDYPRTLSNGVMRASDGALWGLSVEGGARDAGTAFRIQPQTGASTVLHAFGKTASDGLNPSGQLVEQPDGHFVGVSVAGGASGCGMVFRMHPAGHIRALHHFTCAKNGGDNPEAPPVQAADGWHYGVTLVGGHRDAGMVYRLGPRAEFEVLHAFEGYRRGDAGWPIGPLVLAPDGWWYGVTAQGGANDLGVIYRIAADGRYERVHDFDKEQIGFEPAGPLMLASDGLLYGATRRASGHGDGAVFRLVPGGRPEALHAIDHRREGLRATGALTEGPDGHLYFMLAWGTGAPHPVRTAPLMRLDRATGAVEVVGRVAPGKPGIEVLGPLAVAPDGSLYGTTLLPDGGVVFRFAPK